jgi:pimeloyl-ACP methyl ester carboxylesterase
LQRAALTNPGYLPSLLSTVRHFPMGELEYAFKAIGHDTHRATMIVWPELDSTTPYENLHKLRTLIPHARVVTIPDAAHADPLVNEKLCGVLAATLQRFMMETTK